MAAAATTLLALPALLVTACGNSDNGGAQSNTTTSAVSTPTEQNPPQPGRAFTADPTITNSHPLRFDSWSRVAPDRIAVNFQIGSPECYGVDATTTETDTTVTVDLKAGTLPEAVGRMCTMIAVFGTLEIPLKKPLGDRKVLSSS
ncbi:hypothetical protein HGA07_04885 [Nocardia veterana]|uniref:Large secreted protein n=1 Tax=Nocardia veterana TaxID=132249 RepID=A0A7X6LVN8_9NOCA|nr:hypothetical protein [Nocardia veterana]